MKKLVLVDGHAVFHRAYHALPPLTTSRGELVNAVFGFTSMLLRAIADIKPDYIAVAFDRAEPTFRHQEYTAYKAQRVAAPEELHEQLPRSKEVLNVLNIPVFELAGYEADDIIGTLVKQATENDVPDLEIIIVTGDRDTLQLLQPHVKIYTPGKSFSDVVYYDQKIVKEKYGLEPKQFIDFKALAGDPSDNIPGVRGIGEKGATELIQKLHDLKNLYAKIEKSDVKEKIKQLLLDQKKEAYLSKKLVTIQTDLKTNFKLEDARLRGFDVKKVVDIFTRFEFKSLMNKIPLEMRGAASDET